MSRELIEQLRTAEATGEEFGIPASGSLYQMARIEIERLQSERDGLEGVNKILQVKHERLQARLEVDPRHNYDGIDSRDVTIRLQDEMIDALEAENGRMQEICAAAYQMAGVVNAPVRFLDVLSSPYDTTQEQIDALLPVAMDEFKEMGSTQQDADRFEWWFSDTDKGNFLNTYMQGMRERWDLNHWRAAIDAARATSSVPETSPPIRQGEDPEA